MLRLTQTAVGPVAVAAGATTAPPLIEAYNAGDGTLSITVQSSANWLTATVGAERSSCQTTTLAANCIPIQIQINATALAASATSYTGIITVTAPNAIDAPQTITVTAAVGGAVPSSVTAYVAPGGSRDVPFTTNSMINGNAKTTDGASWLSLALQGTGSFRFTLPYNIHIAPQANQGPGAYTGTLTTSGSNFPADNKTIAVTMQVTTQPIAQASPGQLNVSLAQGAPAVTVPVSLLNTGQGTLTIGSVNSGAQGATAAATSSGATVTFDPGALTPGTYTGPLTIASNAANGSVTVPITFTVEPKGAPVVSFQSVVDNAIFKAGDAVAPGDIVALFGDQLFFNPGAQSSGLPLATTIGTTQVLVNGVAAPLFYASYSQINLEMPVDTPAGVAQVQVVRDGVKSNVVSVPIAARAPRLLPLGGGPYGVIHIYPDNAFPLPTGLYPGILSRPAHVGDTLTIYAFGLGDTVTPIPTGQAATAADPLVSTPTVFFGGFFATPATPSYAGLNPTFVGLYQINVTIPEGVSTGNVDVKITFPDGTVSNPVQIAIQ